MTAAKLANKKRRAPVEAVRLKVPNSQTRSSKMKNLALTYSTACNTPPTLQTNTLGNMSTPTLASGNPAQSPTSTPTTRTPTQAVTTTPTSRKSAQTSMVIPTSWKPAHSVPLSTPSTSGLSGNFHTGGGGVFGCLLRPSKKHGRGARGGTMLRPSRPQPCARVPRGHSS